ncbi:MAG: PIG-L family deacetylase [Chloroflexi bacterium]|nr:PIG-L family deacetylase [Chloroflexota bacterium]
MRWIYISPHFDDAVLSCGGLIWEQTHSGTPVEIWTINAGDPPAGPDSDLIRRVHAEWNTGTPAETVMQRRIEDQNAARQVGATVRHLSMVDAIYRRAKSGALMYTQDVFGPIHPQDAGIVQETAQEIARDLDGMDKIVCPLALGGHVDHVIVRTALETIFHPLYYYADIPYLFKHEDELAAATTNLRSRSFFISDQGLKAWQQAIEAHESQVSSLFGDLVNMQSQIKNYRQSRGGLSLWEQELQENA